MRLEIWQGAGCGPAAYLCWFTCIPEVFLCFLRVLFREWIFPEEQDAAAVPVNDKSHGNTESAEPVNEPVADGFGHVFHLPSGVQRTVAGYVS